ncbi:ABC transporter ATP-binding protein [Luteibacter rhizovicinus DSM 16549]|uniref:ABC transporter ATP-binding protein n=1 Tax=Luteibacter rhizovicinus DSM 16549 TaxID=1440763 RepID=A0A0G9HE84_9GAMM|nr:ATP-binding cassette domain-containing protein [Luteibacter rhizovicinus]APG05042.1 ABC transporter ATP-binding protein [Luteibacter rhizovicinus DSM 16549]KLD67484.1 ABC transporter ATP-binding protein [Luteibacter rhizovicinus DSM 16549]
MTTPVALVAQGVSKRFIVKKAGRTVVALDDVSIEVKGAALTALVGPDGAGKTTLLRLAAGLMVADAGTMTVLGIDAATDPQAIQNRISYMPQRFGLYDDLSVQENLDLYADLHGVPADVRGKRYQRLMEMTDLGRFTDRPAGKLSGGMKQKLGLACTLVRSPELLLLDEPTVGVDPLSRRELWQILEQLVGEENLSVLVSTSYMDEAARCAHVAVLHDGKVLAQGTPASIRDTAEGLCFAVTPPTDQAPRHLQARLLDDDQTIGAVPRGGKVHFVRTRLAVEQGDPGLAPLLGDVEAMSVQPTLEDGFMLALRSKVQRDLSSAASVGTSTTATTSASHAGSTAAKAGETVIEVKDLVRTFGDFTAVDRTSFSVSQGEIFGLLGPNGAGKTTTFRMLCGLLPASGGTLRVAGYDLRKARAQARQQIGYVSQKFALYGNLTVDENLTFFGGAYGLSGKRLRERMDAVKSQFELDDAGHAQAGLLPGGFKQRLAMATGLLHEPDILFLDEPTSGADPLARREFWRRITALAEAGTTVVITTHFMEEAEYCDRVVIQDAGKVLALGTPAAIRRQAGETDAQPFDMEQAFIGIVEQNRKATRDGSREAA